MTMDFALLLLTLVGLGTPPSSPAPPGSDSLTVVVHVAQVKASMRLTDVQVIFRAERCRWPDGTRIVLALMKTSTPTGRLTAQKLYGMTPFELNRFWLGKVFRGEAQAPRSFNSEEALLKFVASTPGAVGVVRQSVTDSLQSMLRFSRILTW